MAKKKIKLPEIKSDFAEEKKNIIKSKTFWVNAFMALVIPFFPEELKPLISSPEALSYIFAGVNIALRLLSNKKVTLI